MLILVSVRKAGEEGIEPSNAGFRVRCLTTWRLPIGHDEFSSSVGALLPSGVSAELARKRAERRQYQRRAQRAAGTTWRLPIGHG